MEWLVWIIRVLAGVVALYALFWVVCGIIGLFVNMEKDYPVYSRFYGVMFAIVMRVACFSCGARVRVIGKEKLPKGTRYLLVQNHRSNFDPMITAGALMRERLTFVTKEGNYKIPLGRRYMKRNGYLVLDRGDVKKGAITINKASEYIKNGEYSVGIYPEGTRNKTGGDMLEFKPGCFKIALWAKCPIVVTAIQNTEKIHSNFPFVPTKVVLEIIEVIGYDEIKDKKTGEISERVRAAMDTVLKGKCV